MTFFLIWISIATVISISSVVIENSTNKFHADKNKSLENKSDSDKNLEFSVPLYGSTEKLNKTIKEFEKLLNNSKSKNHNETSAFKQMEERVTNASIKKSTITSPTSTNEFYEFIKGWDINSMQAIKESFVNAFRATVKLKEVFSSAAKLYSNNITIVGFVEEHNKKLDIMLKEISIKAIGITYSDKAHSTFITYCKDSRVEYNKEFNTVIRKARSIAKESAKSDKVATDFLTSIQSIAETLQNPEYKLDSALVAKSKSLTSNATDIIELYNMTTDKHLQQEALSQLDTILTTLTDDLNRSMLPGTDSYVKNQLSINKFYLDSAKDS